MHAHVQMRKCMDGLGTQENTSQRSILEKFTGECIAGAANGVATFDLPTYFEPLHFLPQIPDQLLHPLPPFDRNREPPLSWLYAKICQNPQNPQIIVIHVYVGYSKACPGP